MTLAKDGQELEIKWMPGSEYAQAVGKRDAELDDLGTASAADGEARLFRYRGTSDYVALWLRGDYLVEARGLASDTDAFKAVLASLHEVDVDTWLSAMPESVVKPTSQADVIENMLAGIPLPPGFDGGRSRRPMPSGIAISWAHRSRARWPARGSTGGWAPAASATRPLLARR